MRRPSVLAAVLATLAWGARPARADERVLFTAPTVAADQAGQIAEALHARHGVEVIDEARARVLLTDQAAALPPDRVRESTTAAIDQAEAAWADLRLEAAQATLDGALTQLLAAPRPPPVTLVARALFVRSLVDGAAGRREAAARALDAALALDPSLTPSPDRHGPPVARAVEAARRRGRGPADAVLRLSVTPSTAEVQVDGAVASARELRVATGTHLVVIQQAGQRPAARLVDVSGTQSVEVTLEPAPPALAAAQALGALEAGTAYRDLVFVVARALGISRVFEAAPAAHGELGLLVWSGAGQRLATLPDPRRVPTAAETARLANGGRRDTDPATAPSSKTLWWVGGGVAVVAVGFAVAAVLLLGSQDRPVENRLTVTGPP